MSEPKWTPGPWRFTSGNMPRVHASDKTVCGVHQIGRNGVTEEVAANGSLIAAAPELYAQLQDAKVTLEEAARLLVRDHPSVANNIVNQCAIRCGDVLAKARDDTDA